VAKLDNHTASDFWTDKTDLFMALTKNSLDKTPPSIPFSDNLEQVKAEVIMQHFVIYGAMVIEQLADKINEKFNLFPRFEYTIQFYNVKDQLTDFTDFIMKTMNRKGIETKYPTRTTIFHLRDKLDENDSVQKSVKDLINDYFSYPIDKQNVWDFSKSKVWQLRELRNHIAHSNIYNRSYVIGGSESSSLMLRFDVHYVRKNHEVALVVENPHEFFEELFKALESFRDKLFTIIQPRFHSDHYKNQINFGLKF
jgi:hypothetical protein